MSKINITCDSCHIVHEVTRTKEIPDYVIALACNWCIACSDKAESDYEERYIPDEEGGDVPDPIIPVPDNQLVMPFIFDELEIKKPNEVRELCLPGNDMLPRL